MSIKHTNLTVLILSIFNSLMGQSMPQASPIVISINQDFVETKVHVKKGDFVCFIASGAIQSANVFTQNVSGNLKSYFTIPSTGLPNYDRSHTKVAEFAAGCLFAQQGDFAYPSTPLSTDENDFKSLFFSTVGIGDGFYFIAQADGPLSFGINDNQVRAGKFEVEIYSLTKEQHRNRNKFNKCPKTMRGEVKHLLGELLTTETYTDPSGNEWYRDDQGTVDQYHNGMPTFRGLGTLSGCQCSYKKNYSSTVTEKTNAFGASEPIELLIFKLEESAGIYVGSFDYGYYNGNINYFVEFLPFVKSHFIMDVYPHRAYLRENEHFIYTGTIGE